MVNVGDMFYVQASDSAIQQGGECGGAVTATLKYLLENKVVDGVLAMKRGKDIYDGVPTLITCLLYTSDAADDLTRVDLGGRRIIKKKKTTMENNDRSRT